MIANGTNKYFETLFKEISARWYLLGGPKTSAGLAKSNTWA